MRLKIQEIRLEMSRIRRMKKTIYTNYYNGLETYDNLLHCWKNDEAIVFAWDDDGIKRIYFYACNLAALAQELAKTEQGSVIDFITKDMDALRELFQSAGFEKYMEYARFEIGLIDENAQELNTLLDSIEELHTNKYGEMAMVEDAEVIDAQLRDKFDPYEAHFYSIEQLRDSIRKGWVWVAKEDGKVIAADIFEIQGKKAYGTYLYNYGSVDVLTSLIANTDAYISRNYDVHYSYCWMNLANKRIIRYNTTLNGYRQDGVFDMIYVKKTGVQINE